MAGTSDDALLEVLHATADAVHLALAPVEDWSPMTDVTTQYAVDLVADAAALEVLLAAGLGALSEESGRHHPERSITVVVDPVDGSTNASRRLPWYATSLCALDADGPRASLVVNQSTGERFEATRGGGARFDGRPIAPTTCDRLDEAVVGLAGFPERHLGWWQFRSYGAAALDLCSVACGRLDAFLDPLTPGQHGPWDYLGGLLVCAEVGVPVVDLGGLDLVTTGHGDRRAPVAAATPALLDQLLVAARPEG